MLVGWFIFAAFLLAVIFGISIFTGRKKKHNNKTKD